MEIIECTVIVMQHYVAYPALEIGQCVVWVALDRLREQHQLTSDLNRKKRRKCRLFLSHVSDSCAIIVRMGEDCIHIRQEKRWIKEERAYRLVHLV